MRRRIIGDIHGCDDGLLGLIAAVGLTEDEEVISVGSRVARGPGDAAVPTFFLTRKNARGGEGPALL